MTPELTRQFAVATAFPIVGIMVLHLMGLSWTHVSEVFAALLAMHMGRNLCARTVVRILRADPSKVDIKKLRKQQNRADFLFP